MMSLISFGILYTVALIKIFCGSGKDNGMFVNISKVVDTLLHPLQLRVDFSYPEKRKKIKDHSLLKQLDHCSKPSSFIALLSLSGFSM